MYAHPYHSERCQGNRRKYRIARRGRFTIFIIVSVVTMILIATAVFATVSNASEEQKFKAITVQPGDTVWDIAGTWGDPDASIRQIVHSICILNDLDTPLIYPGQTLMIPLAE